MPVLDVRSGIPDDLLVLDLVAMVHSAPVSGLAQQFFQSRDPAPTSCVRVDALCPKSLHHLP